LRLRRRSAPSLFLLPKQPWGAEANHPFVLDRGSRNLHRSTFRSFATGPLHGKLTSRLIAWSGWRGISSLPKMDIFARPPRRPRHYMWAHAPGRQGATTPNSTAADCSGRRLAALSLVQPLQPSFNVVVDTPHNGCWIKWGKFSQEHLGRDPSHRPLTIRSCRAPPRDLAAHVTDR
jgi:hypothetical protein